MITDRDQAEAVLLLLRSLMGAVETRETMGAVGLYLQGAQFGLISDGRLRYRTDAQNRADYEQFEAPDDDPFCPAGKMPGDIPWRTVPGPVLDDPELLRDFTQRAWEAAKRARKAAS